MKLIYDQKILLKLIASLVEENLFILDSSLKKNNQDFKRAIW